MRLVVTTPGALVLDVPDVAAVRAEDTSGGFGILPGHTDFLTVLPVSVLTWIDGARAEHNVALRRGVLRVSDGALVSVAAREAGALVMQLLRDGVRPSQIITRESLENAFASVAATGGSTNAVLHLLAIAREAGVAIAIDDFDRVSARTPPSTYMSWSGPPAR